MRKLKVYNITISHTYILQNDYHIKFNIHHFMYLQNVFLVIKTFKI